jgi:alkanesulfonate monooxygenase SsuD/methylene tetrahydromethanopterin reductase-like flavin-dependent oxidoreductase (luciferase family)
MKLGVGLPSVMPYGLSRQLLLDWARMADEAGFQTLSSLDRPNYDVWDPLITLAAAAAVTSRARLATTVMQLPNRNEVMVAKQAAVIDRLSDGRLDLGLGLGGRPDDYEVYGATMEHRVTRFRRQVDRIRETWSEAHSNTTRDFGPVGPAPVQEPGPPIWIGANPPNEAGQRRAVELGDAFVFGAAPEPEGIAPMVEKIRGWARERGKKSFPIYRIAYVALGGPQEREEGVLQVRRYYPAGTPRPYEEMVHHGSPEAILEWAKRNEAIGLDLCVLLPLVQSLKQVELLAEHVLPAFGSAS